MKDITITPPMRTFIMTMMTHRSVLILPSTRRVSVRAKEVLLHTHAKITKMPRIVSCMEMTGRFSGGTVVTRRPRPRATLADTRLAVMTKLTYAPQHDVSAVFPVTYALQCPQLVSISEQVGIGSSPMKQLGYGHPTTNSGCEALCRISGVRGAYQRRL